MITYPSTIITDQEKLHAVWSLLEQMRLEHNRVGDIARSDWENYKGKWAEYSKQFSNLILPLHEEQNRLKDAIRLANYTDKAWMALTSMEKRAAYKTMFGDKAAEKVKGTGATSDCLIQLKVLDLSKLTGKFDDPVEDFSTYTETDPASDITTTSTRITCTTMVDDAGARVYKDYTAGHFGNFTHLYTLVVSSIGDSGNYGTVYPWAMMDVATGAFTGGGYAVYLFTDWGDGYIGIIDKGDDSSDEDALSMGTYYLKTTRATSAITNYVYSDSGRTALVSSQTTTANATTRRYLYGTCTDPAGAGYGSFTYYVENLDLQEAAAATAALTGTATAGITETDVVTGGKTIIITLTGDTWVATVGADNAITTALIAGIDSAQSEAAGWDAVVKAHMVYTDVVRTSNTVVTVTLGDEATYNITATETITVTIPATAVTLAAQIVATPTFTVTATAGGLSVPISTYYMLRGIR